MNVSVDAIKEEKKSKSDEDEGGSDFSTTKNIA